MDIQSIRYKRARFLGGAAVAGASILGAVVAPASRWWLIAEGTGVAGGGCITVMGLGGALMSCGGLGAIDEDRAVRVVYTGAAITIISTAAFAATLTGSIIVGALAPAAGIAAGYGIVEVLQRRYERREQS